MKIFDIAQQVFGSNVFPGHPGPEYRTLERIGENSICNLSDFHMCCHNGTHVDAPAHFVKDGKTIDEIPLDCFVGYCYVAHHDGDVTAEDAKAMLRAAEEAGAPDHLLISGKAVVTEGAAELFAKKPLKLIGNESQTVGPEDAPAKVHQILLSAGVVLLEGVRLEKVCPGRYLLNAAPLNLNGLEGAPCRAWLMRE